MALFVCDRCSWAYPYESRKRETGGAIVCPDCFDGSYDIINHPQNRVMVEPEKAGLEDARPEVVLATTEASAWSPRQTVWYKGD